MVKELGYKKHNYKDYYDEEEHYAYVTSDDLDVKIEYSTELDGDYSEEVIKYIDIGQNTIYYKMTKEGYYPMFGTLTVEIELENPQTFDNIAMYGIIGMFSLGSIVLSLLYIKNKKIN